MVIFWSYNIFMNNLQKIALVALRVAMGWMFFWAGITKVLDPSWTSAGYLGGAKAFNGLFEFLSSPNILPIVDFLNQWGLTLLGVSLILGVFVSISAPLGALLMVLYYLPLGFPQPNTHAYIVDEHVVYFVALIILMVFNAGNSWSIGRLIRSRS